MNVVAYGEERVLVDLSLIEHTHTHTQGYGEVMDDEDEDDEEGLDELIQNPEFLHSVLSSLPGVNPEEALQNLEQMKDQQQQKDKKVTS